MISYEEQIAQLKKERDNALAQCGETFAKLSNKEKAQLLHGEIHKLASIMGREFGESEGRFLRQYATQINNDFNNPPSKGG